MEKNYHQSLPAIWFSGFFGLAATVHLIRLLFKVPVTIRGWSVPLRFSVVAILVAGALSAGLLYIGRKRS